jgi:hypothetical protein
MNEDTLKALAGFLCDSIKRHDSVDEASALLSHEYGLEVSSMRALIEAWWALPIPDQVLLGSDTKTLCLWIMNRIRLL